MKTAALFLDFPAIPFPAAYSTEDWREMLFSASRPSMAGFFTENSNGKVRLQGDLFGPIRLARTYRYSVAEERAEALRAAIAITGQTTDMRQYSRLIIFMPQAGRGWGGSGGGDCIWWESPAGYFGASTVFIGVGVDDKLTPEYVRYLLAHEMGDNLGPHHATSLAFPSLAIGPPGAVGTFTDYGDPYSVMGGVNSAGVQNLAGHLSARHKLLAGWLEKSAMSWMSSRVTLSAWSRLERTRRAGKPSGCAAHPAAINGFGWSTVNRSAGTRTWPATPPRFSAACWFTTKTPSSL